MTDLVQNSLGQGCVEISNVSSAVNGSSTGIDSYGQFQQVNSNFPFVDGLILSTGSIASAANTFNATTLSEGDASWQTDSDLETVLGLSNTLNATSIEFDFISANNTVEFNYILASEEYFGTNPCNESDAFVILIKEVGSTGPYTNLALVPGTTLPTNSQNIRQEIFGFCEAQNPEFFEGYSIGDTNFNGRTTVLTATANINRNVSYHIKFAIADKQDSFFDSAVFIQGSSFEASVDLGEDITTCAESLTIDGSFPNNAAIYSWFKDGTLIPGETNPNLTVTESGTYSVAINIPFLSSSCSITDAVEIVLNAEQSAGVISDFIKCDDPSGDGVEVFDLSTKTDEALAAVPDSNYTISYHASAADASNNINPLPDNYTSLSNPQTIYVAIKDVFSGCLAFSTFDLVLISPPVVSAPTPIVVCDKDAPDGRTRIDLDDSTAEILGSNPNFTLTYHNSYVRALSGSNPINSPYNTRPFNDVLYIRVTDSETGCSAVTTLDITILEKPTLDSSITHYINACLSDGSQFADFNLNSVTAAVLDGLTGVDVSFHELETEAETGANPITNSSNYQNTNANFQTVYMRVVDNTIGCPSVEPIELHTNIFNTGLNLNTAFECDDASLDGIVDFDLTEVEADIVGDLEGFNLIFYESQSDQDSNSNAIDTSVPYTISTAPQAIYVSVSNGSCSGEVVLDLGINPPIEIQAFGTVDYCDNDQDGITNISLPSFNAIVNVGISSPSVRYYLTETDALNDENNLGNNFTNTANPQLLYVRVTNNATSCFDVAPLTIDIHPAPVTSEPSPIIICDNDQDGFFTVNLSSKISEIVSSTANLEIKFYESQINAENEEAPILSPSSYNASTQTIYTRVTIGATGCFSVVELPIFINTTPVFGDIADFENCEPDGSVVSEFFFNLKDEDVLDGQTGKDVLYFESEQDAIDRVNAIDKFSAYTSISIPQTIYVRVESITDVTCFGTSEFDLAIGFLPNFNEPTDLFICDDISNDGITSIDLNDKLIEITSGITDDLNIAFYESKADAINQVNQLPLNYTTSNNPQQVFARIDEGESCFSLVDILVNVIPVPSLNPSYELVQCDVDYDGLVNWDITSVVTQITEVRFSDVDITYHLSLEGAETDTQIIPTATDFDNTVNPQTIYLKVNNILSNCAAIVPVALIANGPPALSAIDTVEICSNDEGSTQLSSFNQQLLEQTANVLVSYYASESDAINQINVLDDTYFYASNNDTLFARVQFSTTQCLFIKEFNLKVNPTPIASPPMDLEACDDDYDGLLAFDLNQQNASILGSANPSDFFIYYYNDLVFAQEGFDPITYVSYAASNNETLYARLEHKFTGCYDITSFTVFVNPLPVVNIDDQILCLETSPLLVSANTNIPGDSYLWSTTATTPEIEISSIGNYSVTVTSALGCATTRSFEVTESEIASIEFTEVINFDDPNNVTVTVTGSGDYLYQLDNLPPQQFNVFQNVPLGYHTITIIDQNGCGEVSREIVVMDTPKFMTPNGDTYFDTWHITGVENLPGTIINIYDRYGKLLKQLSAFSRGWDGTYNGQAMPASDYWYVAKVRQGDQVFELKGHFTLRR
ncbi:T9SS type B sorting domain-containing protein [Subsaximicrobium wynnwilliamsii]|uniref:T9SS type B sorting domain-containing protein n=1 Tax=Subsaximicrobium wynnwilliamsii TaxID=291179 RepID=A0A5C6ZDD4_9FLAO|nr:T9SS type B sorting domain-containing protein [Subsaximicrobium wynnwilliamsii]TXD81861.1 T9SS type B sorting domain-containing protein [Subsaximicrobium wynnwilliamsii]TXD87530.1 T9SS type B sorting domain-containing protein [Subsaximicrobium wynnwilliamsii]TXE01213.1 T9SS type B sorting domain-containing protein [Subsaximicrobium wynnwilliamsii]